MGSKSLANSILSDLRKEQANIKKEKKENAKKNEELCISIMQKLFDEWLHKGVKIEEEKYYSFPDGLSLPSSISKADFLETIESLGFRYLDGGLKPVIYFAVPKFTNGIMSKAQIMRKEHVITFNKAEKIAQQEIKRVWECIKAREFSSKPKDDESFVLTLVLSSAEERCSYICDEMLKTFLHKHSFDCVLIRNDMLSITVG